MQWVILTQEFTKLHKINSVKRYGYNVGLDQFLDLKICGIDMDRVIEFLSTLNNNGIATITKLPRGEATNHPHLPIGQ